MMNDYRCGKQNRSAQGMPQIIALRREYESETTEGSAERKRCQNKTE
jgi:hypothetical protein